MTDTRIVIHVGGIPRSGNTYIAKLLRGTYDNKCVLVETSKMHEPKKFKDYIDLKSPLKIFILPTRNPIEALASEIDGHLYSSDKHLNKEIINYLIDRNIEFFQLVLNNKDLFIVWPLDLLGSSPQTLIDFLNKKFPELSNCLSKNPISHQKIFEEIKKQDTKINENYFLHFGHIPREETKTRKKALSLLQLSEFYDKINYLNILYKGLIDNLDWFK